MVYFAQWAGIDSRKKVTARTVRVSPTDAEAWLDAADDAARQATDVGLLIAGFEDHSNASTVYRRVIKADDFPDAIPPSDEAGAFNFDQFRVTFQADGRRQGFTVPARDNSSVNFSSDGFTVEIEGAGAEQATLDWVAAIEGALLGIDGGAATVESMKALR